MKTIFTYFLICCIGLNVGLCHGQDLIVNPVIPPTGLVQKEQLWNLLILNPARQPRACYISLTITDKSNGQQVLSAFTNFTMIPPGTRQLKINDLIPITYTSGSPDVDISTTNFLPLGDYQICYNLIDGKQLSGNACVNTTVSILSPPQLLFPENKGVISIHNPSFSWTPPIPASLTKSTNYEYKVVKVNEGQVASDAVNDNLPVYISGPLPSTYLNYPSFAPQLEKEQQYAWQISALNQRAPIKSDVWTFMIKDSTTISKIKADTLSYAKLSGETLNTGYALAKGTLKFEFLNPSKDSVLQFQITDITQGKKSSVSIPENFIPRFTAGKNMITLNLASTRLFNHNHLYILELEDINRKWWKLLFEYKGK